jgi:hypothetical protein
MVVLLSELLGILCVITFYELSLIIGLDRILEYFYVILILVSLGLTNGIG